MSWNISYLWFSLRIKTMWNSGKFWLPWWPMRSISARILLKRWIKRIYITWKKTKSIFVTKTRATFKLLAKGRLQSLQNISKSLPLAYIYDGNCVGKFHEAKQTLSSILLEVTLTCCGNCKKCFVYFAAPYHPGLSPLCSPDSRQRPL